MSVRHSTWVWPLTKGDAAHASGLSIIYTTSTLGAVTTPPMALALSIYSLTYLPGPHITTQYGPLHSILIMVGKQEVVALVYIAITAHSCSVLLGLTRTPSDSNGGQVWRPCLHSANLNPVYSLSECDVA